MYESRCSNSVAPRVARAKSGSAPTVIATVMTFSSAMVTRSGVPGSRAVARAGVRLPEGVRPRPGHRDQGEQAHHENQPTHPVGTRAKRPLHDRQLAEEAGQRRHTGQREQRQHRQDREPRMVAIEPAEPGDVCRTSQPQQHTADEEQVGDDDDVVEQVEDGASQRRRREKAERSRRVPDVSHEVERQDAPEVALVHRRHQSDHHRRQRHGEQERWTTRARSPGTAA